MPIASSIYWTPTHPTVSATPGDAASPIFVRQRALAAIHDHVAVAPGAASLGFLIGDVLRSPDTGTPYIIVQSAIGLPWRVAGGHTKPVVSNGLVAVNRQLRKDGWHLLGWYHGHLSPDGGLSPDDVDMHETFFTQPWQVALAAVHGDKPRGGWFQRSVDAAWPSQPLPFYELLDATSLLLDGRKVSDLAWTNYQTTEPIMPSERVFGLRAGPSDAPSPGSLIFPEEVGPTPPLPGDWRLASRRAVRLAPYAAVGLLALIGLLRLVGLIGSTSSDSSARARGDTPEAVAAAALNRVDRAADTLALAVAAFEVRARLFQRRQMGCPELARGLIDVEERWISYNVARKATFALDAARDARDRAAYASVDAVERRFETAPCPRP